MAKKITLETLHEAVASGFEDMGEGIDGVEKQIGDVARDLGKLRGDVRAMDAKVSGIWNVLDEHLDRIRKLETVVFRK